jgi:hypothetical protein
MSALAIRLTSAQSCTGFTSFRAAVWRFDPFRLNGAQRVQSRSLRFGDPAHSGSIVLKALIFSAHPLPPPFVPVPARTAPAPAPQAARSQWYEARPPDVPRSACPTVSWAVSTQGIALFSGHSREILGSPQCFPLTRGTTPQPKPPLASGAAQHGNAPCRTPGPRPAGTKGDALLSGDLPARPTRRAVQPRVRGEGRNPLAGVLGCCQYYTTLYQGLSSAQLYFFFGAT